MNVERRTISTEILIKYDFQITLIVMTVVSKYWKIGMQSVSSVSSHWYVDTEELDSEEKRELEGSKITQEDLKNHPQEVREVAHFSMNLRMQSRATVDAYISNGRCVNVGSL